jgi:hypothetical protein
MLPATCFFDGTQTLSASVELARCSTAFSPQVQPLMSDMSPPPVGP